MSSPYCFAVSTKKSVSRLTFDRLNERRGIAEYNAFVLEEAVEAGGVEGSGIRESRRDAYCLQLIR